MSDEFDKIMEVIRKERVDTDLQIAELGTRIGHSFEAIDELKEGCKLLNDQKNTNKEVLRELFDAHDGEFEEEWTERMREKLDVRSAAHTGKTDALDSLLHGVKTEKKEYVPADMADADELERRKPPEPKREVKGMNFLSQVCDIVENYTDEDIPALIRTILKYRLPGGTGTEPEKKEPFIRKLKPNEPMGRGEGIGVVSLGDSGGEIKKGDTVTVDLDTNKIIDREPREDTMISIAEIKEYLKKYMDMYLLVKREDLQFLYKLVDNELPEYIPKIRDRIIKIKEEYDIK